MVKQSAVALLMAADEEPVKVVPNRGIAVSAAASAGVGGRGWWWWRSGRAAAGARAGSLWRVLAAELCGAALLLLLSCLRAATAPQPDPLLARALNAGLAVAFVISSLDHVSGAQVNPAVTLAAALAGQVSGARAAAMAVAQVAGAALGLAAVAALGGDLRRTRTAPAIHLTAAQAVGVEAALGFCIALVNLAAWDPRNSRLLDSWPLRAGLSVAALSLAGADLTGASMNPARSIAPALLTADWDHLWVYCAGPLCGAAAAAALYAAVWSAPPHAPARPAPA